MSARYAIRKSLLMCAAIALFVTACAGKDDIAPVDVEKQAFEDLKAQIRETIDDPTREAEAIRIVGVLENDLESLRSTVRARKDRVRQLNANYDTSRAEFEYFIAEVEADVRENKNRVSSTHRALLAAVSADERSAIRRSHTKAMNAAIRTIQEI